MIRRLFLFVVIPALVVIVAGGIFLGENALRMYHNPPPPSHFGQRVEIKAADGVPLVASWFPSRQPDRPAVIIFHGVGDTRVGMGGLVQLLQRHDYAVLVPDSRAHGESGGAIFTFGLREVDDVHRWVQWIGNRRLYGLGESMGAGILLETIGRYNDFRAVVAECPFASFRRIADYRVGQHVGFVAPAFVEVGFLYARFKYGLNLDDASPLKAIAKTKTPVLLIHGTADSNIPIEHTRLLAAANPAVQVWEVPGGGHVNASSRDHGGFDQRVSAWFDSH